MKARKLNPGFTLIEALTFLFIFSLITMTFYSVLTNGISYIIEAKNRLGALSMANEKMEIVRNLKYDDVGTVDGEVGGNIAQDEDVNVNGRAFHVNTLVEYVQDPLDGVYPADVAFEDYKRVTINVSWASSVSSNHEVSLSSYFVPAGLEVAHLGDGIMTVYVYSNQGGSLGIAGSNVHLKNDETGLDTEKLTESGDNLGSATFMGDKIKDSFKKYEITVTKTGYETVKTLPPYPITPYDPDDENATVVTNGSSLNMAYIVQNKLTGLKVSTFDFLDHALADIDFHLVGGRKLGTQHDPPNAIIYNLDVNASTNNDGEKDFSMVSPGPYTLTLSPTETDYEIISTDPVSPFALRSDESDFNLKVKLAKKSVSSLLVNVLKNEDNLPIPGAEVHLTNASGYDVTQNSGENGSVFFPTTEDIFQPGIYDLKISAEGYDESNSQVTINSNELKVETVKLISP